MHVVARGYYVTITGGVFYCAGSQLDKLVFTCQLVFPIQKNDPASLSKHSNSPLWVLS